jgi:hypothetical protein
MVKIAVAFMRAIVNHAALAGAVAVVQETIT